MRYADRAVCVGLARLSLKFRRIPCNNLNKLFQLAGRRKHSNPLKSSSNELVRIREHLKLFLTLDQSLDNSRLHHKRTSCHCGSLSPGRRLQVELL